MDEAESIQSTDLLGAVEQICREKIFQDRFGKNLQIELDDSLRSCSDLQILAHPAELRRVLSNLLNNAIEAPEIRSSQRQIRILLRNEKNSSVELMIQDNGIGIPAEVLPRLINEGGSFGKTGGSGL